MSNPYIGEIRLFAGSFAPVNWALCNGQIVAISQNEALYQLISTTYGGDGVNTFALPDLQGRVPVHVGQGQGLQNYVLGQKAGFETISLTGAQMPSHSHGALGSVGAPAASPQGATWGNSGISTKSFGSPPNATMNSANIASSGNGAAHDNLIPFLVVTFIISLAGQYPSQN
jgi:microcystin-dependent protein